MSEIRIVVTNGPHEGLPLKTYPDVSRVARHMRLPIPGKKGYDVDQLIPDCQRRIIEFKQEMDADRMDGKRRLSIAEIKRIAKEMSDDIIHSLNATHAAYEIVGLDEMEGVARYRFLKEVHGDWHPREDGLTPTEYDDAEDFDDDF